MDIDFHYICFEYNRPFLNIIKEYTNIETSVENMLELSPRKFTKMAIARDLTYITETCMQHMQALNRPDQLHIQFMPFSNHSEKASVFTKRDFIALGSFFT